MNPVESLIRDRGPISVAEYMELALYHPEHGYYAAASRRSGRNGDFFTSVDVGPLFGRLLAVQIAEMWSVLRERGATGFHLVEVGAGDGRLARDLLDAVAAERPDVYEVLRVTLVERSPAALGRHGELLEPHARRILLESSATLPHAITGAIVANELLDAMPVHVVVMTAHGLCEVHICSVEGELREVLLPLANDRVEQLLDRTGVTIPRGVRAEVGLAGADWIEHASRALDRGFMLVFDYGHEAGELYSEAHAAGTLVAYRGHTADSVRWLQTGCCDLTAHVNLTAVRNVAVASGLTPLGAVDQTYFLTSLGLAARLDDGRGLASVRGRLAARTLILPGGLGSTIKVMAFGKGVGTPALLGFATGRVT